jgi:hypothetical protein
MAVTKITARQTPLVAVAPFTIANIGAGNEITVALPPGASLTGGTIVVTTAFNAATNNTLTVTDGVAISNTLDNLEAIGIIVMTLPSGVAPRYYPNGGTITLSIATVGAAATAGAGFVTLTYIDVDRQDERYGV